MTHRENSSLYLADDGKMFVRKSDNFIMGDGIDIGINDSIENYEEKAFTEEEISCFWKSIGMEDLKKQRKNLNKEAQS